MTLGNDNYMIIMGIDPGYGRCGYGFIKKEGNKLSLLDYGCIETDPKEPFSARLLALEEELLQLITLHQPNRIGIEELFFAKNTTTALKVAHARGIILLVAKKQTSDLLELKPNHIKQAITGQGSADKRQMQQMVKILLNLAKTPKPDDAADALATAIAASTWNTILR